MDEKKADPRLKKLSANKGWKFADKRYVLDLLEKEKKATKYWMDNWASSIQELDSFKNQVTDLKEKLAKAQMDKLSAQLNKYIVSERAISDLSRGNEHFRAAHEKEVIKIHDEHNRVCEIMLKNHKKDKNSLQAAIKTICAKETKVRQKCVELTQEAAHLVLKYEAKIEEQDKHSQKEAASAQKVVDGLEKGLETVKQDLLLKNARVDVSYKQAVARGDEWKQAFYRQALENDKWKEIASVFGYRE
jgi:hypothetical protein